MDEFKRYLLSKKIVTKKNAGGVDTTGNRKPVSIHGWNQPADGKDCIRGNMLLTNHIPLTNS